MQQQRFQLTRHFQVEIAVNDKQLCLRMGKTPFMFDYFGLNQGFCCGWTTSRLKSGNNYIIKKYQVGIFVGHRLPTTLAACNHVLNCVNSIDIRLSRREKKSQRNMGGSISVELIETSQGVVISWEGDINTYAHSASCAGLTTSTVSSTASQVSFDKGFVLEDGSSDYLLNDYTLPSTNLYQVTGANVDGCGSGTRDAGRILSLMLWVARQCLDLSLTVTRQA